MSTADNVDRMDMDVPTTENRRSYSDIGRGHFPPLRHHHLVSAPDLQRDQHPVPTPGAPTPGIADRYADLIEPLTADQRRGLIARLSDGYYDGWRPSRAEMADLVAVEMRMLTIDEYIHRQRQRKMGKEPVEIISLVLARNRRNRAS